MEASMWMPHGQLRALVRSIALGSGLIAGVAGTTQIPAAIQEHELCTEVVESADATPSSKSPTRKTRHMDAA